MPTADARIQTAQARRYLVQLCKHAGKISRHRFHGGRSPAEVLDVEWSDTNGSLTLSLGTCTMRADSDALTLRATATDEASLRQLQELLARDLERFGKREQLAVNWT